MIVIDGRRDPARAAWRSWRRRLQGAISRTLASSTPAETWSQALPALNAAADAAKRAQLAHQFHQHGRDSDDDMLTRICAGRVEPEAIVAATMGPKRCVQILMHAGVDFDRAFRLVERVGASVSAALAFADVPSVVVLDDEGERGAA
jgi:hypothetical protein